MCTCLNKVLDARRIANRAVECTNDWQENDGDNQGDKQCPPRHSRLSTIGSAEGNGDATHKDRRIPPPWNFFVNLAARQLNYQITEQRYVPSSSGSGGHHTPPSKCGQVKQFPAFVNMLCALSISG